MTPVTNGLTDWEAAPPSLQKKNTKTIATFHTSLCYNVMP